MTPFIADYLEEVLELLGDPSATRRATPQKLLRRLSSELSAVYEELLKVSGQQSQIGYTETNFTLVEDQDTYRLPGGFRRFIALEKWVDNDDRDKGISDRLMTKDFGSRDRGVRITTTMRGMRIWPMPTSTMAGVWKLRYNCGPVKLHYGTAGESSDTTTIYFPTTPSDDAGAIVKTTNYYMGQEVRLLSGESEGEVRECSASTSDRLVFSTAFSSTAANTVYEILPPAPDMYQKVYAVSVALGMTTERTDPDKHRMLRMERHKYMKALRNLYRNTTRDRTHKRLKHGYLTVDPFAS